MCLLITLFNILINKKAGHLGKRKTDSSARERTRKLHTSGYTNSCAKKEKFFFIPMKVQLITISSVIPYISEINSTSSSLKKKKRKEKKRECEREGEGEGKGEERERERGEERLRKRGRESEKEKEKEKKEEKEEEEKKEEKEEEEKEEEEKIEKAVLKVHRSLQTHSLAQG